MWRKINLHILFYQVLLLYFLTICFFNYILDGKYTILLSENIYGHISVGGVMVTVEEERIYKTNYNMDNSRVGSFKLVNAICLEERKLRITSLHQHVINWCGWVMPITLHVLQTLQKAWFL